MIKQLLPKVVFSIFRKKVRKNLVFCLMIMVVSGCAGRASTIPPVAVSSLEFRDMSCEETKSLLAMKVKVESALTRKQNNAALGDTVGVFLVLRPLGSVFGADVEGELAQAKGEVAALRRVVTSNCK